MNKKSLEVKELRLQKFFLCCLTLLMRKVKFHVWVGVMRNFMEMLKYVLRSRA